MPAYLVQAHSKTALNSVVWDRRVHNLEMSATYLETCILGIWTWAKQMLLKKIS